MLRRHPFVVPKLIHELVIILHDVFLCRCQKFKWFHLSSSLLFSVKVYKDFFFYLLKYEKECVSNQNIFSPEFRLTERHNKMKLSRKYIRFPFLMIIAYLYSFFRKNNTNQNIVSDELTETNSSRKTT